MSKTKIYIGNSNIAGQITELKQSFEKIGIKTLTASQGNANPAQQSAVDYDFSLYPKRYFRGVRPIKFQLWLREYFSIESRVLRKAIRECNAFIFIWDSFRKDFSDLEFLKKQNKKVYMVFCGDDVRWFYSQKQEFESYNMRPITYEEGYGYTVHDLEERLIRLRKSEKYADAIFSRLDQAQMQLRPYYRWNMMVNADKFPHNPIQRKLDPVVLHAPTSRVIKGTDHILKAFEKIKSEGISFTPMLVENKPRQEMIKLISQADIVIDQLGGAGSGKLATEALATGKVVMSHMAYDRYPQKNPAECPIIDVNPDTIYQNLKDIILNYDKRVQLASSARDYVLKYLDTSIFCKRIVDLIEGKQIEFDYKPDFFRYKFIPESKEATSEYNKWNDYLKEENWYKKEVQKGERSGLVF